MDTEGFDRHVAASLRELLQQNRPFLRSEIFQHVPEAERRAYHGELRELGYRIHKFNAGSDPIGQVLEPADLMHWRQFDSFDGPHTYEDQLKGLSIAEPFFSENCLVLVDDTNWEAGLSRHAGLHRAQSASLSHVAEPENHAQLPPDVLERRHVVPARWVTICACHRLMKT